MHIIKTTLSEKRVGRKHTIVPVSFAALFALILFSISPLDSFAATTTVSSTIAAIISISSTGSVGLNTTPTAAGAQTTSFEQVIVNTNNSAGYTLKINEATASTSLVSGSNSIPASAGTFASPIVQAVNTWGYRVVNAGGFGSETTTLTTNKPISSTLTFAAVPATASPDTIKTTSAVASNDATIITFGVAANTSVPSGTYSNSVVFTATTN